jgi:hypothetical protein
VVHRRLEGGDGVRERLPARGLGREDDVVAAADRLDRRGLMAVESVDPPLRERVGHPRGEVDIGVDGIAGREAAVLSDLPLVERPVPQPLDGVLHDGYSWGRRRLIVAVT